MAFGSSQYWISPKQTSILSIAFLIFFVVSPVLLHFLKNTSRGLPLLEIMLSRPEFFLNFQGQNLFFHPSGRDFFLDFSGPEFFSLKKDSPPPLILRDSFIIMENLVDSLKGVVVELMWNNTIKIKEQTIKFAWQNCTQFITYYITVMLWYIIT